MKAWLYSLPNPSPQYMEYGLIISGHRIGLYGAVWKHNNDDEWVFENYPGRRIEIMKKSEIKLFPTLAKAKAASKKLEAMK